MANQEEFFDKFAPTYDTRDASESTTLINAAARKLCGVPAARTTPPFRLLDVGAGTGALALDVAPSTDVCGVDLSDKMLDVLRAKAAADPELAGHVAAVHADFCSREPERVAAARAAVLETTGGALFDAACSSFAMHHMTDVAACAQAVFPLLRAGGRVAFFDLLAEEHTPLFHSPACHKYVLRFGLAPADLERWFTEAGFVDVHAYRFADIRKKCDDGQTRVFGLVVVAATKP